MVKKFNGNERFIENVGLSRPRLCFKIELYKLLKKFPALSLSSHFLNKLIKMVCRSNEVLFL